VPLAQRPQEPAEGQNHALDLDWGREEARAQQFLKDELARGPKRVTDVEEAAAKAHLDVHVLEQARADLGIVTSRANTGGVQEVLRLLRPVAPIERPHHRVSADGRA
jgi:hypothetical protein